MTLNDEVEEPRHDPSNLNCDMNASDKGDWPCSCTYNPGCLSPKCEAGYETCSVCKTRRES